MSIRALYVDDEPALLEITKLFLEQTGEIIVDCAECATDAEKSLLSSDYDVIISDYQMPGTSGIDFLKRLRSNGCETPFILFTGRERDEIAFEALSSGADFYMHKGGASLVQFAELENYIKQGAQRYRSEKARREIEDRIHSLMDNSFEGIGVHINTTLVEANKALCDITGYCREELVGKRMEELFTNRSWSIMREKLKLPVAKPYAVQVVRKGGGIIEVKTRGKNIAWNGQVARFSTILDTA